jgi:uncharacterized Zn finger protein
MNILMNCPECKLPQEHPILGEIVDEDNNTIGYTVKCRICSHIWDQRLKQ